MLIRDLYQKYQIMPQLATHMLRVAGVGKLITDSWNDRELAVKSVIACLVHDLGNLAKFKLGPEYQTEWGPKQEKLWEKWGHDAHVATYGILKELGMEEYVEYLLAEAKLYESEPTPADFEQTSRPALVVLYADLRVAMSGVVSLEERIADLAARYSGFRAESRWGKMLEGYVQTLTSTDVRSITEKSVTPLFDELLRYNIEV
ncbi:MAG: HD domain-containing protein [bacterium]